MSPFFKYSNDGSLEEVNYTRAGYIAKILNSLVNSKPALFGLYILSDKTLSHSFIQHSYCKSCTGVL